MSQSWWITVEWDVAWTASVRTPGRGHGGVGAVVLRRCRSGHGYPGCVWGAKTHGIQTEKWGIHGEIMVKPSETKWNHEIINFISAVSWFLSKSAGQVVPKNWLLDAASPARVVATWVGLFLERVTTWSGAKQRRGPSSAKGRSGPQTKLWWCFVYFGFADHEHHMGFSMFFLCKHWCSTSGTVIFSRLVWVLDCLEAWPVRIMSTSASRKITNLTTYLDFQTNYMLLY